MPPGRPWGGNRAGGGETGGARRTAAASRAGGDRPGRRRGTRADPQADCPHPHVGQGGDETVTRRHTRGSRIVDPVCRKRLSPRPRRQRPGSRDRSDRPGRSPTPRSTTAWSANGCARAAPSPGPRARRAAGARSRGTGSAAPDARARCPPLDGPSHGHTVPGGPRRRPSRRTLRRPTGDRRGPARRRTGPWSRSSPRGAGTAGSGKPGGSPCRSSPPCAGRTGRR